MGHMIIWSFISIAFDQSLVRSGSPQLNNCVSKKTNLMYDNSTSDSLLHINLNFCLNTNTHGLFFWPQVNLMSAKAHLVKQTFHFTNNMNNVTNCLADIKNYH